MKAMILSIALFLCAAAAQAEEAIKQDVPKTGPVATYNVVNNDQVYHITELIEKRPVKRKLFGIREKNYWVYRCLDTEYPVILSDELHAKAKDVLKDVPDKRDYADKHPHRYNSQVMVQRWGGFFLTIFQLGTAVGTYVR